MTKIVAVSGTQGSGKSTLLTALKERGYRVDDFKVSRHVQEKLGAGSLSELIRTKDDVIQFQQLILEAKMAREEMLAASGYDGIILTERSFADISSYANIWLNELTADQRVSLGESVAFQRTFGNICSDYQQIYSGVLMLPYMEHVGWEEDPNRAAKQKIESFNLEMNSFLRFLQPSNVPVFYIDEKTVEARVSQVISFLNTI